MAAHRLDDDADAGPVGVAAPRIAGRSGPRAPDGSVERVLPWLVAVAFLMESLDTTILNTAVPTIAAALGVAPLSMKAVLASYTLSLAVFIPISGWMADRYGTRRVFLSAIAIFTLGSLLCGLSSDIHMLVACRILQGCGGAMMVPVGRLTMVRTFPRSELVRAMSFVAVPALLGPMLGPVVGGFIAGLVHWRMIFFVNLPFGLLGLYLVHRYLPDYRAERSDKLDVVGFVLFGSGVALLSYVMEIFGEHALGRREILGLLAISIALLSGYGLHAYSTTRPLLNLGLFRIRTLRAAIAGSFITRLGVGGVPFLLPLLYQVGLGYTPVQSGLLILPQSLAAMGLRMTIPVILQRVGYRRVLLCNTLLIGVMLLLFATVGPGTPVWVIVAQAFCFGLFSAAQYASMNTLVYADVAERDASMASTIASTAQQLSMSFGVATASLATAFFVPERPHSDVPQMVAGVHEAFVLLGGLTALSTLVFRALRDGDGDNVSRHHAAIGAALAPGGPAPEASDRARGERGTAAAVGR